VVADQQRELLAQVMGEEVGARERGGIRTRTRHKAVTEQLGLGTGWRCPTGGRFDAHIGVAGAYPVLQLFAGHKALHGIAQVLHALRVNGLHAAQGRVGVVKDFRGNEG